MPTLNDIIMIRAGENAQKLVADNPKALKENPILKESVEVLLEVAREATYNQYRDRSIPKGTNQLIYRRSEIDQPIGGSCQVGGRIIRKISMDEYFTKTDLAGIFSAMQDRDSFAFEIDLNKKPLPAVVKIQHKKEIKHEQDFMKKNPIAALFVNSSVVSGTGYLKIPEKKKQHQTVEK